MLHAVMAGQRSPFCGDWAIVASTGKIPIGRWDVEFRQGPLARLRLSPAQTLVVSFGVLVLLGTLGLKYIPGLYTGQELGWADALFTATSASCVTGLVVVDTATYFTFRGQAFILLLIQLGGLGMITLASMVIVAMGRRLSLRQELLFSESSEVAPHLAPRRLILDVVRFTLVIELVGALLLWGRWGPVFGWDKAVWPAVFHSISAFCNAGFSTFSTSLMPFQRDPFVLAVIMALIVIGGLGFLSLEEVYTYWVCRTRGQRFRVSLHTRVVLVTTLVLLVLGWALFAVFEWNHGLSHLGPGSKLANALFMSVTPRTAGFNTLDYAQATESSNLLTMLLMMVGGSPGSTAGGVKTTTVALVLLLAWSRLRGREIVSVQGRSVPEETIQRSVGLVVGAGAVVVLAIFVLTISERGTGGRFQLLDRTFEVVSAVNTVGLSTGLTPLLSEVGRVTITILMFLGRVGPLTLAAALAMPRISRAGEFRYAYEQMAVG